MKVSLALPIDRLDPPGEFLGRDAVIEMAQLAENEGYHAVSVTDHPVPTGRWLDAGGHHAQDPFAILSFVAAATKRIQFQTGILVMTYRNPFLTARTASTIEAIAPGRLIMGVGAGYMKGEYKALGADFDNRNDIMDEYLRAYILAMTQTEFTFDGTGYTALGNRVLPLAAKAPPMWVGGNSRRAIRRAAEFGDAWHPFHTVTAPAVVATARTAQINGEEDLREGIVYLKENAEKFGRPAPADVVLDSMQSPTPEFNAQALIDQIEGLAEIGVTWIGIHMPGRDRAEWSDNARRFAREVMATTGRAK